MKIKIFLTLFAFMLLSCADLSVDNMNEPDTDRALSSETDLVTLAEGLYYDWYTSLNTWYGFGIGTSVLADAATSSWGNFGMREFGTEPRPSINNSPSWSYLYAMSAPFENLYAINSSATDVLNSLRNEALNFGNDAKKIEALAKFGQGMSMGYAALIFDQGYIVDENSTPDEISNPELVSYGTLMDHALTKLIEAATIAENNSFDISTNVINSTDAGLSSAQLSEVIHSYAARLMANVARSKTERSNVDWNSVITHLDKGVQQDFTIVLDQWEAGFWWNSRYIYATRSGWTNVDMRIINMMNSNYPAHNPTGLDFAETDSATIYDTPEIDNRLFTDYSYNPSNFHRPERGLYFFSNWRYSRHAAYDGSYEGTMEDISKSEVDMLRAEALAQNGNLSGAAAVLNDVSGARKLRGGLPDVSANLDDIMTAIHHERMVEQFLDAPGAEWFDMRGMDLLQQGSPLHFPIPANILETLGCSQPFYTYGGASAPPTGNCAPSGDYWNSGTSQGGWR
jgi:hypothetical protein